MARTQAQGRLGTEFYQAFYLHTLLALATILLLLAAAAFTSPYASELIAPTTFYITPELESNATSANEVFITPCIYPSTNSPVNETDRNCGLYGTWYCAEGYSCGDSPVDDSIACYRDNFDCKNTTACWQRIESYPLVGSDRVEWQLPFSISIPWLTTSYLYLAANFIFCVVELIYFLYIRLQTDIPDSAKTFRRLRTCYALHFGGWCH